METGRLTAFFAAQPDVRLAYLFGSQARGDAGPGSDVDVAVVLDAPTPREAAARRDDLHARLLQVLRRNDVDLVLADRASPLLRHRIAWAGVCLWAREPVEATRFAVRALADYADTAPLRAIAAAARTRRLASGAFGVQAPYHRGDA